MTTHVERLRRTGILRQGSPRRGFRYVHAGGGRPVRRQLQRIKSLRLPPAWRDVAINPSPGGRLQAVGRDAAGRWQYVYHPAHVRERERKKFARLLRFGAALPQLRRAVAADMRSHSLSRERVLATMVRMLSCAFIRPGSETYAAENGSYGIATLRGRHVRVSGDTIHFDFPGKSGKRQQPALRDRSSARVVRALLELPGYEVFKYVAPEGGVVDVRTTDLNHYIKRHMGAVFSAKDFRTWTATLLCACALARGGPPDADPRARRKAVVAAIKQTAEQLGNTPAICRASYVSPCVTAAYERGHTIERCFRCVEELISCRLRGLHPSEKALLAFLKRQG